MRSSIVASMILAVSFPHCSFGQSEAFPRNDLDTTLGYETTGYNTWNWSPRNVKAACVAFAALNSLFDDDLCSDLSPSPVSNPTQEPIMLVVNIDEYNGYPAAPGTMQMALLFHNQNDLTYLSTWQQPWHAKYELTEHPWNARRLQQAGSVAGPYPLDQMEDWEQWEDLWDRGPNDAVLWDQESHVGEISFNNNVIDIFDNYGNKETVKLLFTAENRGGLVLERSDDIVLVGDFFVPNYPTNQLPAPLR